MRLTRAVAGKLKERRRMKNKVVFMGSCLLTTALLCGQFVGAGDEEKKDGPVKADPATALIDECKVTASFVNKDDGLYARFEISNPSDEKKEVDFNFVAQRTDEQSMMSRMGPMPQDHEKRQL